MERYVKRSFALLLAMLACAPPAAADQPDAGLRAALQRALCTAKRQVSLLSSF
jgi:hypothetical protein